MGIRVIYHLSNLTGGVDSTYLDYMDGDSLTDKDRAFVIFSGVLYLYELDADSGATESSPSVISPDTNPGDKRWILVDAVSTAADADFVPLTDNTYNLGSAFYRWANIYTADLHLKNDIGDWTLVEGESDIFLINNKTGKKSKIVTEEV